MTIDRPQSNVPYSSCRLLTAGLLASSLCAAVGCRSTAELRATRRYDFGLVVILPGIEGPSVWNRDLALGLDEGGVAAAIEIYDWSTGIPGDFLGNLTDLERNQRQAQRLSEYLANYERRHPRRPICLVGHSGGAGIALLTLDQPLTDKLVDLAILLAPAVSPGYDLSVALRHCRYGVIAFYSERDVTLLKIGTSVFGPIDRERGVAAGAAGFDRPDGLTDADRGLYAENLRQIRWTPALKRFGADGSHMGWTSRRFAREYLAPIIQDVVAARPAPKAARMIDLQPDDEKETPHVDGSENSGE